MVMTGSHVPFTVTGITNTGPINAVTLAVRLPFKGKDNSSLAVKSIQADHDIRVVS